MLLTDDVDVDIVALPFPTATIDPPVTVAAGSEVMLRGIFLCALVSPVAVTVSLIMDDISSSATAVGIGECDIS